MTESKSRKSSAADLSTLDGNSFLDRLALVKERVLEDAATLGAPFDPTERDPTEANTVKSPAQLAAELADTLAVLDECAVRLRGTPPVNKA